MTTTNTFGIVFYVKKYKAQKGKAPIQARITVDGKSLDLALKRVVDINENWNGSKNKAKVKDEGIRALITYMEKVHSQLIVYYQQLQLKKKLITTEVVKELFCSNNQK